MSDSNLPDLAVRDLVEQLSTSAPIPGGGSAAAVAGAMAAGLIEMVVALTVGRPAAAEHEEALTAIARTARHRRTELLELAQTDAEAYASVVAARRLPRDSDAERSRRGQLIAEATRAATLAPLRTARAAESLIGLAESLAPIANRNAVSDVGVGALLAASALRGAGLNVLTNLPFLPADDVLRAGAEDEIRQLLDRMDVREAALRATVEARLE